MGDESRPMLTRIYGLAFAKPKTLKAYKERRGQLEELDHRKLGRELELFHMEDLVGKGLPLWLPKGTVLRDAIEDYVRELEFQRGYARVQTPPLAHEDLYLKSQHKCWRLRLLAIIYFYQSHHCG